MPALSSSLSTPAGVPAVNGAHVGKFGGLAMHFPTLGAFTAAVTQERIDGYWSDGQPMTVASEAQSRAVRVWSLASQHARTVRIGIAQLVLAADSNIVLTVAGVPANGTGANGDLSVDWAAGLVYLKSSGAWASIASTSPITTAVAAAVSQSLAQATGGTAGFVGECDGDNWGMNWVDVSAARRQAFPGTEDAAWIRWFINLNGGLFATGTLTLTSAFDTYQAQLAVLLTEGKKVCLVLDPPLTGVAGDETLFVNQLRKLMRRSLMVDGTKIRHIHAVSVCNEFYAVLSVLPYSFTLASQFGARLAPLCRYTWDVVKEVSPKTEVWGPSSQGGEGSDPSLHEAILAASTVSTVAINGNTGVGRRGEHCIEGIEHHPYAIARSITLGRAALTDNSVASTIEAYTVGVRQAQANRRLPGSTGEAYWAGREGRDGVAISGYTGPPRPDYKLIAGEVNISYDGALPQNGLLGLHFAYQSLTPDENEQLMTQVCAACKASKYDIVFIYDADHGFGYGPGFTATSTAAGQGGCIRFTTAIPIVEGTQVLLLGGSLDQYRGYAARVSPDGLSWDAPGTVFGTDTYTADQIYLYGDLLGGAWRERWSRIQAKFDGYLEAGYDSAGNPQIRVDRAQIRRLLNGKLTAVSP